MNKYAFIFAIISLSILFMWSCDGKKTASSGSDELVFYNHGDSAKYVGIQTCRTCHEDIFETFVHTGMGLSFDLASKQKSSGNFENHPIIYDSVGGYQYSPLWRGDTLFVVEEKAGYNYFKSTEIPIQYIIGSGQHTNSHIWSVNGYLMQAPFTYYVQSGKWDLPPGFEKGNNSRFSRKIGLECMSCHNAMPISFQLGSDNRFGDVPRGIDCERCHGPGSLHVNKIKKGIVTDTSKFHDPTIVNPKRLSPKAQVELCQRCHLQGNAVLAEGKSFFDFKPGMTLASVMDVYIPRYTDSDDKFIMASHADRLQQSECFSQSQSLSCVSCHNPHVSVRETNISRFNKTCTSCHVEANSECSESSKERMAVNDNCSGCHMPVSSSIDIPHVTVHDHKIQVPQKKTTTTEVQKFLGLSPVNNANPSVRSRALAYIQQFEKFGGEYWMLDSADYWIAKMSESKSKIDLDVQSQFLRGKYSSIVSTVQKFGWGALESQFNEKGFENRDAYFWYRIAESFNRFEAFQEARRALTKATDLAPLIPDFHNKFGSVSLKLGDVKSAELAFETVRSLHPMMAEGWGNGGYVELFKGDTIRAVHYFENALLLDPDYTPARRNLAAVYIARKEYAKALEQLRILQSISPSDHRIEGTISEILKMKNSK